MSERTCPVVTKGARCNRPSTKSINGYCKVHLGRLARRNRILAWKRLESAMLKKRKVRPVVIGRISATSSDFRLPRGWAGAGVWALWARSDLGPVCITVGQTSDLRRDLFKFHSVLAGRVPYGETWEKIRQSYSEFEFELVRKGMRSKVAREAIEATYAIQNRAEFWNKSYTQESSIRRYYRTLHLGE